MLRISFCVVFMVTGFYFIYNLFSYLVKDCTKEYIFLGSDFYKPEILKTNVSNQFLSTKSPFEFVFSSCECTKFIFIVKKLVGNLRIKAFWYTKFFQISLSDFKTLRF